MTEQNRKTLRSFYCRDYLWELFEVMARDLGCSMDYLINEAMRNYARSRNYSLATGRSQQMPAADFQVAAPAGAQGSPAQPPLAPQPAQAPPPPQPLGAGYPTFQPPPPASAPQFASGAPPGVLGGSFTNPPLANAFDRTAGRGPFGSPAGGEYFPPAPPQFSAPSAAAFDARQGIAPTSSYPAVGLNLGQALPSAQPMPPAPLGQPLVSPPTPGNQPSPSGQPVLHLLFQGQKYRIDKEKFIIGRGSQMTDLTIRDGNISRKHAAVIFRSGKYFIKDLDSTNGIDYLGSRIDSKKIEEGDVFHICDYELRFTYR